MSFFQYNRVIQNKFNSFGSGLIILLIASCFTSKIHAQDLLYPFEHYNDQSGLTAVVREIIQDNLGFLWLATSDGLYRFDGKSFKVFRNKLGDTTSVPNNIINDLCIHPNGEIWIASNGGLCYFNYTDNYFKQIKIPEDLEKTDRYRVHSVTVDYFGQIWFTTKTTIHLLDSKNELCKTISLPFQNNFTISKIYFDALNQLFVGTNTGELVKIDLCTNAILTTQIGSKESNQLNLLSTITDICPFTNDTLIVASWYGGLHKISYTDTTIKATPIINDLEDNLQNNVVTSIAKIKTNLWWAATHGSGILFFDPVSQKILSQIKYNIANPNGLSDNYINEVFVDKTGIVWIGTDDGMNKYDKLSHQFFSIKIPNQKNEKSIYRRPSCIVEDRNAAPGKFLWISVPGIGLFHYDRKVHNFEFVPLKSTKKMQMDNQLIYDMMYNHQNQLILCMSSGIYFFNEAKREIGIFKNADKYNIENIREVLQDKNEDYWFVSGSNGIYRYTSSNDNWTRYSNQPDHSNSLPDNSVFCLFEDHDGYIWIGTQNRGLSRLNPKDGSFLNFEHHKLEPRSIPDNNVNDVYEDSGHFLWVATENGLARMNPERNEFKIFTTSEGLSNNDIFFITPDLNGKLWLGTNNGLCVLNPRDGRIINYAQMDGLPSSRIDGASLCCKDGSLYFGTNSMISGCNPVKIVKNEISPEVLITSIKVHGQEISLSRSGKKLKEIKLNYMDDNFSAEFIALNFANPLKNKYAYYLEGYDKHWNYCGSQTTTNYANIPGGNYTFKVKASNTDGIWNLVDDQLEITIQPPFWKTGWFYLISIATIFSLIYVYFRMKIRQILNLQQLRLDIARDLHDDVGSTLSSINMTSSMVEQLLKSGKSQTELFQIIQSASKRAMEMMNDIVWSIKPENDKPEMTLSRMRQYASEILEPTGIEFRFDVVEKTSHPLIPLDARKDLFMIFKEALNNLAKYSHGSASIISLIFDKAELQLVIEDNGVGFNVDQVQKGNGLKNMQERAAALGAIFKISSGPGIGTRIELNIKFRI